MLLEGKKEKLRKKLRSAWDLGYQNAGLEVVKPNPRIMTPEEILAHSGAKSIEKDINERNKRRNKAVERILNKMKEEYLYENVPTGKAKRARFGGIPQRVSASEVEKLKASAKASREPIPEPKERKQRKGLRSPSRRIEPTERVLRGERSTPKGLAQARLNRLNQELRKANLHMDISDISRMGARAERIKKIIKDKENWGKKRTLNNDIEYVLDYLLDEGYVNSYEDGIHLMELMSTEWLGNILIEGV